MVHREIRGKENNSWEEPFPASRATPGSWAPTPWIRLPRTPTNTRECA